MCDGKDGTCDRTAHTGCLNKEFRAGRRLVLRAMPSGGADRLGAALQEAHEEA